jgi:hypothetical protein
MDANPVMHVFATTGSKEINLEAELFSLVLCGSCIVDDFVVVIIDVFHGLGPLMLIKIVPLVSPHVFAFVY